MPPRLIYDEIPTIIDENGMYWFNWDNDNLYINYLIETNDFEEDEDYIIDIIDFNTLEEDTDYINNIEVL